MWPQMIFLVIAIVAVALFVLVAMMLSSKRHQFDKEAYQARWLKIENGLEESDPRSYNFSVLEADKLLDKALNEMGVSGKSMGEKLKKLGNGTLDLNKVWYAHKLRNQIVHESDFEVSYNQARQALGIFRQALKDLGAI